MDANGAAITRQRVASGRIIGIRVLDHIITGRPSEGQSGFFSIHQAMRRLLDTMTAWAGNSR